MSRVELKWPRISITESLEVAETGGTRAGTQSPHVGMRQEPQGGQSQVILTDSAHDCLAHGGLRLPITMVFLSGSKWDPMALEPQTTKQPTHPHLTNQVILQGPCLSPEAPTVSWLLVCLQYAMSVSRAVLSLLNPSFVYRGPK